eukprot:jgi/Psemu1/32032/gm1.32032_g
MSSSSDSSSVLDIYTLKELQQMLTDPELCTKLASKIETEVLARLSTKRQNGFPIGTLVTPSKQQNISDQIGEAEKILSNLNNALSCSEKISNDCAAAITRLSKCTTLVEQLKQQMMRVKEDIIEPLQCTINSAKKRPASSKTTLEFSPTPKQTKEHINVESDESEEDLNQKTASKPKSKKHNNFSKDKSAAYMKNESQNFTKHRFHNLEPGVAVMKLSNHSWKYDTNFPQNLMSSNESLRQIPNAIRRIHTLYRSMVPDEEEEEQTVEKITKIVETHADVVTKESGLEYFMTKFPKMKKLDIDLCGLITSQPGEGTFKHNPNNNAIAVFLVKGQVKKFHYVLVNGVQSLALFMYNWDGKYFSKNILNPALNRKYDEVINKDIIKGINDFNFKLKYYTDGFRCNTDFFRSMSECVTENSEHLTSH